MKRKRPKLAIGSITAKNIEFLTKKMLFIKNIIGLSVVDEVYFYAIKNKIEGEFEYTTSGLEIKADMGVFLELYIISVNNVKRAEIIKIRDRETKARYDKRNRPKRLVAKKEHYIRNKNKLNEQSKKWWSENPEKMATLAKKWRQENPEKARELNKKWARENPERLKTIKKRYRDKNN